jgi:peptide/nickel transport system substrate-binding protein
MMDTAKGPLRDIRVRRAISLAVNYATLQQIAYGGLAKQARGPLSSSIPYFDKTLTVPQRDIDKAKQMLAGTALATGGTLTLGYVGTVDTQQRIVQILQANLSDLGISLTTRPSTYPVLLESFQNPDTTPDFVLLNNNSAYPDPDWTFSSFFVSAARAKGGTNAAWYSNPEVDQLTAEGRVTLDPAKRAVIYSRLQKTIVGDAPAIWNAETVFIVAYRDYVKGLQYVSAHTRSLGYLDHLSVQGKP